MNIHQSVNNGYYSTDSEYKNTIHYIKDSIMPNCEDHENDFFQTEFNNGIKQSKLSSTSSDQNINMSDQLYINEENLSNNSDNSEIIKDNTSKSINDQIFLLNFECSDSNPNSTLVNCTELYDFSRKEESLNDNCENNFTNLNNVKHIIPLNTMVASMHESGHNHFNGDFEVSNLNNNFDLDNVELNKQLKTFEFKKESESKESLTLTNHTISLNNVKSVGKHDCRSIRSINSESKIEIPEGLIPSQKNICYSVDTITTSVANHPLSRGSRSQDYYFSNDENTIVDIDFDDKIASVNALCHDSFENISNSEWMATGRVLEVIEDCDIVVDECKPRVKTGSVFTDDQVNDALKHICQSLQSESHTPNNLSKEIKNTISCDSNDNSLGSQIESVDIDVICDSDIIKSNLLKPISHDADRPSAARLAKRLYYRQGFRHEDIHRHLVKKNSFAQLVGEEYLNYFDFTNQRIDDSLRLFLNQLSGWEEVQDRERLLSHFSHRYYICNPDIFESADSCLILATGILLLNNEIHTQMNTSRTELDFTSNLMGIVDHPAYPSNLLQSIYKSILNQPMQSNSESLNNRTLSDNSNSPFKLFTSFTITETPDPKNPIDYKKGFVMRKCCLDPNGRRTSLGRRGWKMFYATLRDMTLYMHADESGFKRSNYLSNSIPIYHSLAIKAIDYVKKSHVIRLQTADLAQYLIQTSNTTECQEWVDSINFVAANFSAPMKPIDWTDKRQLDRPFLPSTPSRLPLHDQLKQHESMVSEYEMALVEHRKCPPEKGSKSRIIQEYCQMENTLKFELKRFKQYCRLLQFKISTFSDLSVLQENSIIKVDDPDITRALISRHEVHVLHTSPIDEDSLDHKQSEES